MQISVEGLMDRTQSFARAYRAQNSGIRSNAIISTCRESFLLFQSPRPRYARENFRVVTNTSFPYALLMDAPESVDELQSAQRWASAESSLF